jgi:hypothetical protein
MTKAVAALSASQVGCLKDVRGVTQAPLKCHYTPELDSGHEFDSIQRMDLRLAKCMPPTAVAFNKNAYDLVSNA